MDIFKKAKAGLIKTIKGTESFELKSLNEFKGDLQLIRQVAVNVPRTVTILGEEIKMEKTIEKELVFIYKDANSIIRDMENALECEELKKKIAAKGTPGTTLVQAKGQLAQLEKQILYDEEDIIRKAYELHNRLALVSNWINVGIGKIKTSAKFDNKLRDIFYILNGKINRIVKYASRITGFQQAQLKPRARVSWK